MGQTEIQQQDGRLNPTPEIITLSVNCLSTPIER
jgi:hypothetical protein